MGDASTLYEHLVRVRLVSARMIELQRAGKIAFHAASIGDEAAIVAAALACDAEDWVFPGVREWGAALVRGLPLEAYVHHAFGTGQDPALGHAAPDHPPARSFHVGPVSGVPGAHVPQAVGLAWAAALTAPSRRVVSIAVFGEDCIASGDFHNALNFAGVHRVPTVFVCRRDGRAPEAVTDVSARALAYGVASASIDGSDALGVLDLLREAAEAARAGAGPTLIDVVSPAALPFAGYAADDVVALGPADPIARLRKEVLRAGRDGAELERWVSDVRVRLEEAVHRAERAADPLARSIVEHVYAAVPRHLDEQARALATPERREERKVAMP